MNLKTKLLAGAILVGFGAMAAFAGPVCDINTTNNPSACSAKVSNLTSNNVPFTLVNVTPKKTYDCKIIIQGDHPEQVSVQSLEGKNGASVTNQGRSSMTIPFIVNDNTTSTGMVTFTMHNGRGTIWKNESNNVYVVCN